MPKSQEREYRSMTVMAVKRAEEGVTESGGKSYTVRGYASTFNEPYDLMEDMQGNMIHEVVDPHAFDKADMSDVIMQYDHAGMVYARTRNGSLKIGTDDHGLWIEADLGLTEESRKLYEAIDTGLVDRMSFCFVIEAEEYEKTTRTWRITQIGKVYDVSAVSIPANPGTDISAARKRILDGVIEEERTERSAAEARQKKIRMLKVRAKLARAMS